MNEPTDRLPDSLSSHLSHELEELCSQFEGAWQRGEAPPLVKLLQEWKHSVGREELFENLLMIEVESRRRINDTPTFEEYTLEFPEHIRTIDSVFRTLIAQPSTVDHDALADTNSLGAKPIGELVAAGQQFGDYQILEEIARGGMGVVYRARQVKLDRIVALKMILAGEMATQEDVERFYTEAEAAANLRHPNIVAIYEVGQQQGRHFFSMEFVEGDSLAEKSGGKPFAPSRAAEIAAQIADCIEYAHQHGVLHRDIKPSNVLLDEGERPRVTDFGLAKRIEDTSGLTMTGQIIGTPNFMPPEQATGALTTNPQSDVYSIGALLYTLLTGQPPFSGTSPWDTIHQVIHEEPTAPRAMVPGIPLDLDTICLKCLEKSPDKRYASAAALEEDLRRFLNDEPILARKVSRFERCWRWIRRKPIAASLVLSVVLVVAVSVGALLLAARAERIQDDFDRSQQLAEWNDQFDTELQGLLLSEESLVALEELSDRITTFEAKRDSDRRGQIYAAFEAQVSALLRQERFDSEATEKAESAIALLRTRDNKLADDLRRQLDDRISQWAEYFSLSYPFPDLGTTFPGIKLEQRDRSLFLVGSNESSNVLTVCSSDGPSEIEAQFGPQWVNAPRLGLVIHWPRDQSDDGYLFMLRVDKKRLSGKRKGPVSFSMLSSSGVPAIALEIRRGSVVLKQRHISMREIGPGPLNVRARHHGTRLTFQVNESEELEIEDLFSGAVLDGEYCGVVWPAGIPITHVRAQKLFSARKPSPLEKANRFFGTSEFSAAREEYQRVVASTDLPELRQEAQFRSSLCHLRTNQKALALQEFEQLAAEGEQLWPLLAAIQAWALYLDANRFTDAQTIIEAISIHPLADQLTTLLPRDIRKNISTWYSNRLTGYFYIRPGGYRKELETTIAVQRLLGADKHIVLGEELMLIEVYNVENDKAKLLELSDRVLKDKTPVNARFKSEVFDRWARFSLADLGPDKVIERLNEFLFDGAGKIRKDRSLFLVVRARLNAVRDRWDLARADLDKALEVGANDPMTLQCAYYFDGFIRERSGDVEGARTSWAKGFELAKKRHAGHTRSAAMGSLSRTVSLADAQDMIRQVTSGGFRSPVMDYIRKQLVPDELLRTVCLNMWDCPRGRKAILDELLFRAMGPESYDAQVKLTGFEVWRQSTLGTSDRSIQLSPDQDSVLWQLCEEMIKAYRDEKLSETDMLKVALTWKGQTNFLGWESLRKTLSPAIRGPLSYMLGCHYRHKNANEGLVYTLTESKSFFQQSLADSQPGTALHRLAKKELQAFTE